MRCLSQTVCRLADFSFASNWSAVWLNRPVTDLRKAFGRSASYVRVCTTTDKWVETARYKYDHVYSCNICLGRGREYGNTLYGLYEKVLLWADWGLEIREFIQEQVIVYGKVLFQKLYPYCSEHIFSPPQKAALISVWLWSPCLQYYVGETNTDCAGESSGLKAN